MPKMLHRMTAKYAVVFEDANSSVNRITLSGFKPFLVGSDVLLSTLFQIHTRVMGL